MSLNISSFVNQWTANTTTVHVLDKGKTITNSGLQDNEHTGTKLTLLQTIDNGETITNSGLQDNEHTGTKLTLLQTIDNGETTSNFAVLQTMDTVECQTMNRLLF